MFGGNNGTSKFSVTLSSNQLMNGSVIRMRVIINNGECNLATDCLRVQLHRDMLVKGFTSGGAEKEWKDSQIVMKHEWKVKVGKKVPDLIVDDYNFALKKAAACDTEKNRVHYNWDYLEDCVPVCIEHVEAQNLLLPSMDTDHIKVSYKLEVSLAHEATFGNTFEVPSIFCPIGIQNKSKGAIA